MFFASDSAASDLAGGQLREGELPDLNPAEVGVRAKALQGKEQRKNVLVHCSLILLFFIN